MRRALMWLNLYGREAVWHELKNSQKTHKKALLACFRAYVGHIRWATSMPFAWINPTNQRTNLWNFREKILRIGDFENLSFFESAILIFFFKTIFFCFIPIKISPNLYCRTDVVSKKFLAMRNITLYSVWKKNIMLSLNTSSKWLMWKNPLKWETKHLMSQLISQFKQERNKSVVSLSLEIKTHWPISTLICSCTDYELGWGHSSKPTCYINGQSTVPPLHSYISTCLYLSYIKNM